MKVKVVINFLKQEDGISYSQWLRLPKLENRRVRCLSLAYIYIYMRVVFKLYLI